MALYAAISPSVQAKPGHKHPFGSRVLRAGMQGKDVRYLQRALTRLGIPTAIDGAFGKGTTRSVRALEAQRGWPVNGIVSRREAKRIKKLLTKRRVSGSYFVQGLESPALTLSSRHAGNAKVKVLDASGNVVALLPMSFDGAESRDATWNGMTAAGAAADGTYELRLGKSNTARASASGQTQPFAMHLHAFPVPGPHNFGGADARFGAPRSGHVHQGQDIPAACGQKEVVDETGEVKVSAYQASGAGYYVVIHGRITGTDSVYVHLQRASWAPAGAVVYAGQQIGRVGATGDAEGCHLHFERWTAPGWFLGGAPYDPLPELQYWDSYS
ncbi:MAG TPA: peptidoglycan DD-metalloendopeptidase family protein [Solirubrobacterales bacterium]|nr:peptidoglycan DD-metalloendopeptidase family protein [Solirubrobacterales bacterium]